MKGKALVVALLCVMGLAAIFIGNAEAASYNCTIDAVGTNYGSNYVYLSDTGGSFTARVFLIDPALGNSKEMLAVLLTAWANTQNVGVWLSASTELSTVWGVNTVK